MCPGSRPGQCLCIQRHRKRATVMTIVRMSTNYYVLAFNDRGGRL